MRVPLSSGNPRRRRKNRLSVEKGKELEDFVERMAMESGWHVEKRKRYGDRILDLVISKGGTIFIVQCKNTSKATPSDVSQTRKDYESFIEWLLEEKLGYRVVPVLVSRSFSEKAKNRARNYGVLFYEMDEVNGLFGRRRVNRASPRRR